MPDVIDGFDELDLDGLDLQISDGDSDFFFVIQIELDSPKDT